MTEQAAVRTTGEVLSEAPAACFSSCGLQSLGPPGSQMTGAH